MFSADWLMRKFDRQRDTALQGETNLSPDRLLAIAEEVLTDNSTAGQFIECDVRNADMLAADAKHREFCIGGPPPNPTSLVVSVSTGEKGKTAVRVCWSPLTYLGVMGELTKQPRPGIDQAEAPSVSRMLYYALRGMPKFSTYEAALEAVAAAVRQEDGPARVAIGVTPSDQR